MTTFDDRENAFEAKFAHDEELRFRATARRDRNLAAWASGKLGLSGAAAAEYAKEIFRANIQHPGDGDLVQKILVDFKAKGIPLDERTLKGKLGELMEQAVAEIEAGK
jgi:hypothetical protein